MPREECWQWQEPITACPTRMCSAETQLPLQNHSVLLETVARVTPGMTLGARAVQGVRGARMSTGAQQELWDFLPAPKAGGAAAALVSCT